MHALIVSAHPEPRSFNAVLAGAALEVLAARGHSVEHSDLYAMGFNPVVGRADFGTVHNAAHFNVSLEQRHAVTHDALAADIRAELGKLQRADLLIFQFPLWWFGLPAILKGWIDRVFVSGTAYGRSALYEQGKFRGKRAFACVTTGAPATAFGPGSLNGDMLELLAPLHRGVLGFTGMTVLPPFVCYHVPYEGDAGRADMLARYRDYLDRLDELVPLPMPTVAEHQHQLGESMRAKAR
jgi:NAD(P)H dehydrogenase (quinone)